MDHFSTRIADIASTYGTDTIFILGKGPSADAVSPDAFAGSLVIAVNDAERIAPADITLFHADWVRESKDLRARVYQIGDGKLSFQYAYQNMPTVKRRLLQAGVRLAGLLNSIYASSEPSFPDRE